jgi:hypothetical protein
VFGTCIVSAAVTAGELAALASISAACENANEHNKYKK